MSVPQINHVCVGGDLTREPTLNRLPTGRIYAEFGVAVHSAQPLRDGRRIDRICFVEVIAWGRLAETISAYVHKGGEVVVDGSLVFENWTTSGGETRSRLRIAAASVYFIGKRAPRPAAIATEEPAAGTDLPEDDFIFTGDMGSPV